LEDLILLEGHPSIHGNEGLQPNPTCCPTHNCFKQTHRLSIKHMKKNLDCQNNYTNLQDNNTSRQLDSNRVNLLIIQYGNYV